MEIRLQTVLDKLPVEEVQGMQERTIRRVTNLKEGEFSEDSILWISDPNLASLPNIRAGTVICSSKVKDIDHPAACTYLIVKNPRLYFLNFVKTFFVEKDDPFVSPRSVVHSSVLIGERVTIGHGVVIEKNCKIGNNVTIDSNTVIKRGTIIGNNVVIGANNTIGGVGFGYEKNENGAYEALPHVGNVIIEDDVEIGNNTAIDRGVIGSTLIRRNVKIDNLVHIAHGVDLGENSLIIANSMIAGSTVIGRNVWVAPSASVLNKLVVGDDAVIGMGATVLKNVLPNQTVVGNPAKDLQSLKK